MIALYGYRVEQETVYATLASQIPPQWLEAWRLRHPTFNADHPRFSHRACESLAGILLLKRAGLTGELCYDGNGRPFFKDAPVDFSITHTKGAVLCAVMHGEGRVGLDAETLARAASLSLGDLAERWFSERERECYLAEPTAERFFTFWTRKEAAVKASGEGLSSLRESDTELMEREETVTFTTYREGDLILTLCHPTNEIPPQTIKWI